MKTQDTVILSACINKLQFTGQSLGRVFNSKIGCMCAMHLCCYEAAQPTLRLKTRHLQHLGSLPSDIALLGTCLGYLRVATININHQIYCCIAQGVKASTTHLANILLLLFSSIGSQLNMGLPFQL